MKVRGTKRVLFWTKRFNEPDWHVGIGNGVFRHCPISNCETTNDKSLLMESDAVMFHAMNFNWSSKFERTTIPDRRTSEQRWIFVTREPPFHTPSAVKKLNNVFNWTMTYRFNRFLYI
jgi:alpha-1,3-fucosyltransferase